MSIMFNEICIYIYTYIYIYIYIQISLNIIDIIYPKEDISDKKYYLIPQNLSIVGAIYVLKKRSTFCVFLSQKFY